MSADQKLLDALQIAVRSNQIPILDQLLEKLPLEDMEDATTDKLLVFLLNAAFRGNSVQAATVLINQWNKLTPDDDTNPSIFTRLFGMLYLDNKVLNWLTNNLETESYELVIQELINYDANPQLLPWYQRATDLYGIQTNETYKDLLEYAKDKDNRIGVMFLTDLVTQTNPFQEIPDWVWDFDGKLNSEAPVGEYKNKWDQSLETGDTGLPKCSDLLSKLPEIKFDEIKLPSIQESVTLLTANLENLSVGIEELVETKFELERKIKSMSNEERMTLLQPVLENQNIYNLKGQLDLFRILGPTNPHYDADLTYDHICYKYGGCRMMTCVCFEIDSDDIGLDDWFVGSCSVCNLKLRSRAHAFRKPLPYGGWIGCFCSKECIKDTMVVPNILSNLMLDRVANQLENYKLQDRVENTGVDEISNDDQGIISSGFGETY